MTKFLIDENMNQKGVRTVPTKDKDFDIVYPERGSYKGSADITVPEPANGQQRVLASKEKYFGFFRQLQAGGRPVGCTDIADAW